MDDKQKVQHFDRLMIAVDRVYHNPAQLVKRGLIIGFASGVGGILGAAFIILLLSFLVGRLGGLPLIGEFLQKIGNAVPSN